MSQLTKQEIRYIADGYVRKRYERIQAIVVTCLFLFALISWYFTTANVMWFILALFIPYFVIFELLRRKDMKKELARLYEIHGDCTSGELRESAYACDCKENIAINMLNVADKVEEDINELAT